MASFVLLELGSEKTIDKVRQTSRGGDLITATERADGVGIGTLAAH
jgi:hypothetical protein